MIDTIIKIYKVFRQDTIRVMLFFSLMAMVAMYYYWFTTSEKKLKEYEVSNRMKDSIIIVYEIKLAKIEEKNKILDSLKSN